MSIMSIPFLITGATPSARTQKALNIAKEFSSKYDTTVIDAGLENGIETIRNLTQKTSISPLNSKYTTFLLKEAQNLTLEAQNALLKTLEEPEKRSRIILTAPSKYAVLSTLASRCLEITINEAVEKSVKSAEIEKYLSKYFFDRYESAEKLNLDTWLAFWRSRLLESFNTVNERWYNLHKTLKYVKLILKLKKLKKKHLSNKLINSFLLLHLPTSTPTS